MKRNSYSCVDFFKNAKPEIFAAARALRKKLTLPEQRLWEELRGKKISGLRFRRQHPIGPCVVDFYCHEKRIVIELDGRIHEDPDVNAKDLERTRVLNSFGLKVIRFSNEEVSRDIKGVIDRIIDECKLREASEDSL